jgi:SPP1 gp7 family putative phage head morphogenesis protein
MKVKSAIDEKMDLLYHSPTQFVDAMNDLGGAIIKVDDEAIRRKTAKLADLIGQTMQLADALGRKRLLMEADAKAKRRQPPMFRCLAEHNFMTTPVVPHVPFKEAYEDILAREPRIAKSRDEIARAYSGDNGFAILKLPMRLAENARMKLLQRVQKALADFAARGESTASVSLKLASMADFTRSYAETVYRTNLATAFTAGRMKQMQDPDVREVAPAFEFVTAGDVDVRKNHRNTKGLIAAVNDAAWDQYAPPLGYNCRCDLRLVDKYELKAKGVTVLKPHYPPNIRMGGPDPGFKALRTDKRVYGFRATRNTEPVLRPFMVYTQ